MQLVIELTDEQWKCVQDRTWCGTKEILNGKPIPAGHGRLIEQPTDADIAKTIGGQNDFADCIREAVATVFENAETILEADGGDAE